jgi:hypothetical protein
MSVSKFLTVLNQHVIPKQDKLGQILIFTPVKGKFFAGKDGYGRVFVNIPVVYTQNHHEHPVEDAFVVYQLYSSRPETFAVSGNIPLISSELFLGPRMDNFSNLEKLLDTKTLRFHMRGPWNGKYYEDRLGRWVDLTCSVATANILEKVTTDRYISRDPVPNIPPLPENHVRIV